MNVPTIAVRHPDDPNVRMNINEADLTDEHVLWEDSPVDGLRVGKGPRGKWYVKRGKDTVAGPFETEAEAEDAATRA